MKGCVSCKKCVKRARWPTAWKEYEVFRDYLPARDRPDERRD